MGKIEDEIKRKIKKKNSSYKKPKPVRMNSGKAATNSPGKVKIKISHSSSKSTGSLPKTSTPRVRKTEREKQLDRIYNIMTKATLDGWVIDFDPESLSTEELSVLKTKDIKLKGRYVDPETGEAFYGEEAYKFIRSRAAKKASETRRKKKEQEEQELLDELNAPSFVIQQLEWMLGSIQNPDMQRYYRRSQVARVVSDQKARIVLQVLDEAIEKDGIDVVANRIADNFSEVEEAIEKMLYGYTLQEVDSGYTTLIRIIKGSAITVEEAKRIGEAEDEDFPVY